MNKEDGFFHSLEIADEENFDPEGSYWKLPDIAKELCIRTDECMQIAVILESRGLIHLEDDEENFPWPNVYLTPRGVFHRQEITWLSGG